MSFFLQHVSLSYLNLRRVDLEMWLSAFTAHRARQFRTPARLIEEIDSSPPPQPPCPRGRIKVHVRYNNQANSQTQVSQ